MRICVLAPSYVPAHRSGGPVPGIRGVVDTLGDHEVILFTSDRDLGDVEPFPEPHRGTTVIDSATVTYLPPLSFSTRASWRAALAQARSSDVVYLNSLMHKTYTLLPVLVLALLGFDGKVVWSPRGELAGSALSLGGSRQKQIWIRAIRAWGLDRRVGRRLGRRVGQRLRQGKQHNVVWLASSEHERSHLLGAFPRAEVALCPERLRRPDPTARSAPRPQRSPALRIAMVGRIAPVKGVIDLVGAMAHVQSPVILDLVGPAEDETYRAQVQAIAAELPSHVQLNWRGSVTPDEVGQILDESHVMALLTQGENFGHAIGEALQHGCPVLISDQTPWSFVEERGAGTVLPEADCRQPAAVARAIERFVELSDPEWEEMSRQARLVGESGLTLPGSLTFLEATALLP